MAPSIVFDFNPFKLSQDILIAIGLVSTCSAQTESIVEMGIGGCLGLDSDYSLAVTTHMSAPLRDNILRAAAELKIDDLDDLDRFDTLLDEIKVAFMKRNKYLHDGLCQHPTNGETYLASIVARGSLDATHPYLSERDIC